MIYVVEVPHEGDPHAWFAFDGEDLFNKVVVHDSLEPWEVHDVSTPRELMELVGHLPGTEESEQEFPGICTLAREYGWDTPLYRADHVLERGAYQPEPVSVEDACAAALRKRVADVADHGPLKAVRIFWSDPEAVLATEGGDALFLEQNNWRALHALREQLLALDVLAEN